MKILIKTLTVSIYSTLKLPTNDQPILKLQKPNPQWIKLFEDFETWLYINT